MPDCGLIAEQSERRSRTRVDAGTDDLPLQWIYEKIAGESRTFVQPGHDSGVRRGATSYDKESSSHPPVPDDHRPPSCAAIGAVNT